MQFVLVDVTDSQGDATEPARVAHDLANLLGVILTYSSLVSSELADAARGDPERWECICRDVEEIQLAARQGSDLTRQLSAFARHNSARPEPSSIGDVVAAAPSRPTIETVLVVEDEVPLREATRRLLVRNGYEVITAANGLDAIEVAASHAGPIDLLLTDVIMPQMLGVEVAQRITQDRDDVRVLFMSGYTHPVVGERGWLATDVVLLEKPFSEQTLLSKVREVLDGDERPGRSAGVAVQR